MAGKFNFNVVSPDGEVLAKEVSFVMARSEVGDLGILPHHSALIASLAIGVVRYNENGSEMNLAVGGGFMEVANNNVTILAKTAELAEKIDLERAEKAKERAEKRLAEHNDKINLARAEAALKRAIARINAAGGR